MPTSPHLATHLRLSIRRSNGVVLTGQEAGDLIRSVATGDASPEQYQVISAVVDRSCTEPVADLAGASLTTDRFGRRSSRADDSDATLAVPTKRSRT